MKSILPPSALLAAVLFVSPAVAQNATTTPVGVVTTTIAASPNGVTVVPSLIAPPLLRSTALTGSMSGKISSVTSNGFTFPTSDLVPNDLATNGPVYIYFTSGSLEGLLLRVTSNTANSVVVDAEGLDLTTLGFVVGTNGDAYKFISGDTILSLFGTPADGVVGGSPSQFSQGLTDRLVLRDTLGIVRTYYFNTDNNQWRRGGSTSSQDGQPVSPYSGAIYYRVGSSAIDLVSTGDVPSSDLKQLIPKSGVAILSRFFPTDTTLGALGIENLPSWRKTSQGGVTITSADKVIAKDSLGVIRTFYHDGTNWRRGGSPSSQNATPINVGSAIYTTRFGTGTTPEVLSVSLPYSLN